MRESAATCAAACHRPASNDLFPPATSRPAIVRTAAAWTAVGVLVVHGLFELGIFPMFPGKEPPAIASGTPAQPVAKRARELVNKTMVDGLRLGRTALWAHRFHRGRREDNESRRETQAKWNRCCDARHEHRRGVPVPSKAFPPKSDESLEFWKRLVDLRGFEPLTPWLQTRCSPN